MEKLEGLEKYKEETKMQDFNYHTHTYRCHHSDQDLSDEEYIKDFIKIGVKKIAFTDHCPEKNKIDKRLDMRMDYSQKEEYLSSIKVLKEKYKDQIEIETGFETEYLPGEEENIRELKRESDKIILGQHFIYDDNKNLKIFGVDDFSNEELIKYAEYLEEAMKLGIPDLIAHPDIYLYRTRKFEETEKKVAEIICMAAKKYNIPLEINLMRIYRATYFENRIINHDTIEKQKEKLKTAYIAYPNREFWKIASKYNVKSLYGLDAHYKGQIQFFPELIKLAKWYLGEDIISKLDFIE